MESCTTKTCVNLSISDDKKLEGIESFMLTLEKLDTSNQDDIDLYKKIMLTPNNVTTIKITDNEQSKTVMLTHITLPCPV